MPLPEDLSIPTADRGADKGAFSVYRTGRKKRRVSGEDSREDRRQRKIKMSGSSGRCELFFFGRECFTPYTSSSTSAQKF